MMIGHMLTSSCHHLNSYDHSNGVMFARKDLILASGVLSLGSGSLVGRATDMHEQASAAATAVWVSARSEAARSSSWSPLSLAVTITGWY
jgi:hypothetical protein